MIYAEVSDPLLQQDYYRGIVRFDPASADLAQAVLDPARKEELRRLITEFKTSNLEPARQKEILEQMERVLDEPEGGHSGK